MIAVGLLLKKGDYRGQKFTIKDNGNVGKLNPQFPLDIAGNTSINGLLFVQGADLKLGMGD